MACSPTIQGIIFQTVGVVAITLDQKWYCSQSNITDEFYKMSESKVNFKVSSKNKGGNVVGS